ncbi:MAG TPA: hypothetical protein VFA09_06100 [Ktedonobacteraceae bacterium]|nr:hypothetical protein [Ktedonobacteraceae bacterium]
MSKKLLVITAGTVAAGVGRTLLKQMQEHPNSELTVMVRYIDSANLSERDKMLRQGEWFHLSIDERYMRAVYQNRQRYPRVSKMLFDGLLPGTAETGGGSIRYNGAGAVEIKREELRKWLISCMTDLARDGDRSTNVSVALIVSSVGATGSGSLEHLIDVIIDAADYANVHTTEHGRIRCDTYILQPSQDVTDLHMANTLALFAELAASQLTGSGTRSYQGRKILIGWGSDTVLRSIDQLQETAATIVRLCSDPASTFSAEHREREVDNHVLLDLDPLSKLPMHLSLATIVTIGLGQLEEQIIQRDVARLVNNLVFEKGRPADTDNVLLGRFADALAGEDAESRYQKLLDYLAEAAGLGEIQRRIDMTINAKGSSDGEKAAKLNSLWQEGKAEASRVRHRIQDYAHTFTANAQLELERIKGERIGRGGVSLTELREEYRALQDILTAALEVARADTRTSVNDAAILNLQKQVGSFLPFNRKAKLRQLAGTMKRNLDERLQENTRSSAIYVLEHLEQRCEEIGRNLDIVLNKLRRKRNDDLRFANTARTLSIETGNPMSIVALSSLDDINVYASQVSIFTSEQDAPEQLAEFRQWLQGRQELESLFKGNLEQLMEVVTSYTREKIRAAMEQHSILDILHRAGEDSLKERLAEAAKRATALIMYNRNFAPALSEAWHVSAFYRNGDQREELLDAIKEAVTQGQCTLLKSNSPGEIALFYYVDGIPMSAVNDLTGRCLDAFLRRRVLWEEQREELDSGSPIDSINSLNRRVGVPVFSGKDAEWRVLQTGVIRRLFAVSARKDYEFAIEKLPELHPLFESKPAEESGKPGTNGHKPEASLAPLDTGNHQNGASKEVTGGLEPVEEKSSDGTN